MAQLLRPGKISGKMSLRLTLLTVSDIRSPELLDSSLMSFGPQLELYYPNGIHMA